MLQVPYKRIFSNTEPSANTGCSNDAAGGQQYLRYLIEIEFPVCQIKYQGQNYSKSLTEEDLVHLVST